MKIKRSYLEKFSKIEAVQLKQQEQNQCKFEYEMANCEKKLVPGAGDCFLFFANGLNKSESLTHLNLSGCKLHPFLAMEIFQAIALNQKITHLDLSNNNLSSFLLSYLFLQLQANKTLISLNLFNNQHFDSRVIRDMLHNLFNKPDSSLQELNIGFCNFSEEALVKLFFGLKKSDSLTKLKITYQQFGEKSLTALGNYLRKFIPLYHQTNNKFELDISNNMISKEGIQLLLKSQAWYQVHLRSLNLSFNGLSQDSIGTIKQFLDKLYKFKCLNLSHNGLYDVSELSEKCQQFQNLRELDLSNNQLSEFDPQLLPHLLKLNLSNNNIKFNGALLIQEYLKYNPVLKELNLNNNSIKSEGFNLIIFALRQNTNLKYLYVRRNKIQSESLLCMQVNQDGLPLTVLDLSENSLETDQVLMYLSSLKNCELESIKISETEENTKPNSDPLQFLLNAQKLKKLDFSFTKYLGIHMIVNLGHHLFHSLQDLDFSYCIPFTIQGVKGLTKMLTNNDNLKSLNIAGLQLGLLEYHEKESKEIKRIEISTELRKLAESIKSCSLKTLNLSENYLGRHDNQFLEYLALNLTIQNLNLSYNDLSIYHKEQLQHLLEKNRTLQKLSLEGNKIQFNQLFYQLKKQETRSEKKMTSAQGLDEHNLKKQYYYKKLDFNLQKINLSNLQLNGDCIKALGEGLLNNPKITKLDLSQNKNFHVSESFLYQSNQHHRILRLINVSMINQNFDYFFKLNQFSLQEIQIINCSFTQKSFANFLKGLSLVQNLTHFEISLCYLDDYYIYTNQYQQEDQTQNTFQMEQFNQPNSSIQFHNQNTFGNGSVSGSLNFEYKSGFKTFTKRQNQQQRQFTTTQSQSMSNNKYLNMNGNKTVKINHNYNENRQNLRTEFQQLLEILLNKVSTLISLTFNKMEWDNQTLKILKKIITQPECQLQFLDISYNNFQGYKDFLEFTFGLIQNKTLQKINFNECIMSFKEKQNLIEILFQCENLKYQEFNAVKFDEKKTQQLTQNNIKHGIKAINLQSLTLDNLESNTQNLEPLFTLISQTLYNIKYLSLSSIELRDQNSYTVFKQLSTLKNLKSLNLEKNELCELSSIDQLFTQKNNLQELNLSRNYIQQRGIKNLFSILVKKQIHLKYLSLKKNKVSPNLIFEEKKYWFDKVGVEIDKETLLQNIGHLISKEIRKQIQNSIDLNHSQPTSKFSIQFLDLRGNNLGKQSLQDFKFIYKHLKNIFIINDWNGIDNELAITIVNTYIDLYQNYQFQQNLVPYYLKVITINNSEVDDEFCKYFAKKLILLKNLTEIDFSKNNKISSIGLKYLYIYMFDLAAQDLMITKFKIHNNIINKQDENLMSRILQSLAKKFKRIQCIRIKTNAFYSQISRPYKFKLNFYLMDKDGFKEFIHFCKLWMCYSNIVILIQITLHVIIYISDYQKDNDKELQLKQFIQITLIMVLACLLGEIIIYFRVRSLERAQFYFLQKERKKDDKRLVNIHSKWYTYIFPTILQFIDRIEIYFDILLIYAFIGLDKKNYSYKVFSIIASVFIIIKILERVAFFLTWWLKQKNSNWGQDTGEILYESWHLISTQNFYLIQPYIIRTAPTYSYSFFGKYKFEGHTFILSVRLLFETLPILILYITYLILSEQKENDDQIYQFVYIGLFITIILIIVSDMMQIKQMLYKNTIEDIQNKYKDYYQSNYQIVKGTYIEKNEINDQAENQTTLINSECSFIEDNDAQISLLPNNFHHNPNYTLFKDLKEATQVYLQTKNKNQNIDNELDFEETSYNNNVIFESSYQNYKLQSPQLFQEQNKE